MMAQFGRLSLVATASNLRNSRDDYWENVLCQIAWKLTTEIVICPVMIRNVYMLSNLLFHDANLLIVDFIILVGGAIA